MTSLLVSIETTGLQRVADNLTRITPQSIGALALSSVNKVAQRGYDESVKRMLSRYNLTEDYIRERMLVEPANEARRPEAVIVALRSGGRRPGIRPTNLRQYGAIQLKTFTNWRNDGTARNSGKKIFNVGAGYPARNGEGPRPTGPMYANPRKPGSKLPFIKRIGDQQAGIRVGEKAQGISVSVKRGSRKNVAPAFLRKMPNGETLVMARKRPIGSGKGKIEALYSQSVWQMFRRISAEIIPIVRDDLERTVADDVLAEVAQEIVK